MHLEACIIYVVSLDPEPPMSSTEPRVCTQLSSREATPLCAEVVRPVPRRQQAGVDTFIVEDVSVHAHLLEIALPFLLQADVGRRCRLASRSSHRGSSLQAPPSSPRV
jgi:hypothetical protein